MALTHATNKYTVGKGRIYLFDLDGSNLPTHGRYVGNTPGFSATVETEKLEHYSSESGIQQKDASVPISIVRRFELTVDNVSLANQALFFVMSSASVAQTATPVVDEAITVQQGKYYQLGRSLSNPTGVRGVSSVVIQDDGDSTTYVLDTDYELDAATGRIKIIEGGSISDNDVIHVDYTPEAGAREQLTATSNIVSTKALHFVADNPRGDNDDLFIPIAEIAPNGNREFIGTDWATIGLGVEATVPSDGRAAMYIDGRNVASS